MFGITLGGSGGSQVDEKSDQNSTPKHGQEDAKTMTKYVPDTPKSDSKHVKKQILLQGEPSSKFYRQPSTIQAANHSTGTQPLHRQPTTNG